MSDDDIPFLAVGHDELGEQLGTAIECPRCMEMHDIENSTGTNSQGHEVTGTLQFYKCGDGTYLAGIKGKAIKTLRTGRS